MNLENKVSAHEGLGSLSNSLSELWFEIGGSCHLKCTYCFAESGGIDKSKDNVTIERIKEYLNEFKTMGGKRIGIVGAGEPFHPKNIRDTFDILEHVKSKDIKTTIFTTADLLSNITLNKLEQYENIVLLVKYNSDNPIIQDELVNVQGYTKRRDAKLNELINRGFNDGRLGIVTSILEQNALEIEFIFRYARNNNIIFDADTPIPRGRGKTCNKEEIAKLSKPIIERLSKIDREEYGYTWEPHASYIASPPCTRFNQHLYIKKDGTVIPCVGSSDVILGNIKTETLGDIWEKPITKIIREHNYVGKCTSCKNYEEKKCFSCLGRSTDYLTTEQLLKDGHVNTIGCGNHKPMESAK